MKSGREEKVRKKTENRDEKQKNAKKMPKNKKMKFKGRKKCKFPI
jgi:hypothetical protein